MANKAKLRSPSRSSTTAGETVRKPPSARKSQPASGKSGQVATVAVKQKIASATSSTKATKPVVKPGASNAPKLSVAALRTEVERLQKMNATLRTKNKAERAEKSNAVKTVEALQTELDGLKAKVARVEKKVARTTEKAKPNQMSRRKRQAGKASRTDDVPTTEGLAAIETSTGSNADNLPDAEE